MAAFSSISIVIAAIISFPWPDTVILQQQAKAVNCRLGHYAHHPSLCNSLRETMTMRKKKTMKTGGAASACRFCLTPHSQSLLHLLLLTLLLCQTPCLSQCHPLCCRRGIQCPLRDIDGATWQLPPRVYHASHASNQCDGMDKNIKHRDAKDKSHKHHKSTESMESGGDPKRELEPPGRQQWAARVLQHDEGPLTPGWLLLGVHSLGDTQDSSIGGFHHGGTLALRVPRKGLKEFWLYPFFYYSYVGGFWLFFQVSGKPDTLCIDAGVTYGLSGQRSWGVVLSRHF